MPICKRCHRDLPAGAFHKNQTWCKECKRIWYDQNRDAINIRVREWRHKNNALGAQKHPSNLNRPLEEARDSAAWLGVYIAERALYKFFDHVERMPYGNPGYDFVCAKGYKIDVKSSCLHLEGSRQGHVYWSFAINYNKIADFFLCLAFDDREELKPMHVWLIPRSRVNGMKHLSIAQSTTNKWIEFEKPLDKISECHLRTTSNGVKA